MSAQAANNVTRFRQDRRPFIISSLRTVSLVGIIVTIVYCIFNYQEDLNVGNVRRIVSYIEQLTFAGEPTDVFDFDSGLSTVYAPFDVGVATCAGGSFRFIPPFENMSFSRQIRYADPYIEPCGKFLYVYDMGGTGISRFNSYALLDETELDSSIISFSANEEGQCAVVTDEAGFRTAVTVLNKRLKQTYKWQTSDHFAFLASLSPNGSNLAVLCLGQKDGRPNLYIRIQPTDKEECRTVIELGEMKVYSIVYASNSRIMVLGDTGLYGYDNSGNMRNAYEFSEGSLITFSHSPSGCAVSLRGDSSDTTRIAAFDGTGTLMYSGEAEGSVRSLELSGDTLAYISPAGVHRVIVSRGTEEIKHMSGMRDVLITSTGRVAAVYSDSARVIAFETEE